MLLALSLAAPALATPAGARSCCCPHVEKHKCHCPACEHARELESGLPHLRQCGGEESAAAVPSLPLALPAMESAPAPGSCDAAPAAAPPPLQDSPCREVPTPPPLA